MSNLTFLMPKGIFNYRVAGVLQHCEKYLLHKSQTDSHWSLVGGRVEAFEDSRSALVREFKEELGIAVHSKALLWSVENFFSYKGDPYHELGFIYQITTQALLTIDQHEFRGLDDPQLIYKWFSKEALREINLKPSFLKEKLLHEDFGKDHIICRDEVY